MLATVAGIHSGHPWPSPYGQRFALCKKAFLPFCPCLFVNRHPWPSPYGQRFALRKKAFLPFCEPRSLEVQTGFFG